MWHKSGNLIWLVTNIGVTIKFIHEGISTEGAMGKMVVNIIAAVAQAERSRILERTHEGRIAAKYKGIKFGCKIKIDHNRVKEMRSQNISAIKIAKELQISRGSVYKILKKLTQEQEKCA